VGLASLERCCGAVFGGMAVSNPDLQWELLREISDQRERADASARVAKTDETAQYYAGMAAAFLWCFVKVEEKIDIAKERENGQ